MLEEAREADSVIGEVWFFAKNGDAVFSGLGIVFE